MKAIVKTEPKPGLTVTDVPEPPRGADPIIKIEAASICGSDLHVYEWSGGYDNFMKIPLIIGHEGCGHVVHPGDSNLKEGQRILVDPGAICGECVYCRTGRDHICPTRKIIGLHRDGLFAEYAAVPARCCIPLPEEIPATVAACIESLGTAVRGMDNAAPEIGDSAAIIGPGPLGLMSLVLCKAAGLSPIIMFGTKQDDGLRMDMAKQLGADVILHSEDPQAREKLLKETKGLGVDHVFDWSGAAAGLAMGSTLAKPGGQVVAGAIYGKNVELDITGMVRKEISLLTIRSRPRGTWLRTLDLLANKVIDISPIITKTFSLDQAVEAFDQAVDKKILKGVFVF